MSLKTIDELLKAQSSLVEQMTKFVSNTKKTATAKRTHGFYIARLNGWHDIWQQFLANEQQISLVKTATDLSNEYFTSDLFSIQESLYYEFKGELVDMAAKLEQAESAKDLNRSIQSHDRQSSDNNSLLQNSLPRISLPKFTGDYNEWVSFRDLFRSVIHQNPHLDDVQKFHHLKTTLGGEAANIIKHLSITNANYQVAWKALSDRYENKRFLVSAILKTLTSQPKLTADSSNSIKNLLDVTSECLASLTNLGINTLHWDPLIVHLLTQKLSLESHKAWEEAMGDNTDVSTWDHFKKFLETRFRTLEAIAGTQKLNQGKPKVQNFYTASSTCKLCQTRTKHSLRSCSKFLSLAPKDRLNAAKSKGACLNCLGQYHSVNKCLSLSKCFECGDKHHSLLHEAVKGQKLTGSSNKKSIQPNTALTYSKKHDNVRGEEARDSKVAIHFIARNDTVLLATAIIHIKTNKGTHVTRALIDPGSQATFITNSALRRMNLQVENTMVSVTGLGNSQTATSHKMSKLRITNSDSTKIVTVNAVVLDTLTDFLPPKVIQRKAWKHLQGLALADPAFHTPDRIDVLIGADIYPLIILDGVKKGPPGTPVAQNSIFGWILTGEITFHKVERQNKPKIASFINTVDRMFDLQKFWELEDIPVKTELSAADQACEEIFRKTHSRNPDGSYTVRLPFKDLVDKKEEISFGPSRNIALKRYYSLESSLAKKGITEEYNRVLQEYHSSGHMERIPHESENKSMTNSMYQHFYMPHHGVVKSSSSTTKLRVVFDASCKASAGLSLNDTLFTGPALQQDITTIIMRWRFHRYVFVADIEKMYRQIWLHSNDTNFQRIVWRPSAEQPIKDYRLLTVTFGVSCAPYLAIRTLHQLAEDEKASFLVASECLLNDFYVDDVLTGCDSIAKTNTLKQDLRALLKKGGFNLRKFSANHPAILNNLPPQDISPETLLSFEGNNVIKTLGIGWSPTRDEFQYKINLDIEGPPTKRNILSKIARLFDPLGWLSPIIILGKILIQKLWLANLDWDSCIPNDLQLEWHRFVDNLKEIEKITLPRWIHYLPSSSIEFHGFCDSSEKAYGAAIYIRVETSEGTIITNLIIAKSRVAPVKAVSLPRLELCGAHLLSKLVYHFKQNLPIVNNKFTLWTDSTIVLAWLTSPPSRWKSFVANRTGEIHTNVPGIPWYHVSSQENPADFASRGQYATGLINNAKWWKGPEWLAKGRDYWPVQSQNSDSTELTLEIKRVRNHHTILDNQSFLERFSSYTKCCRVIAYCFRFIERLRSCKEQSSHVYLSTRELNRARIYLVKLSQNQAYAEEIDNLKLKQSLPKESTILALNPFLDEDNILRVGGRLEHANIPFAAKHPIILPRKCKLTSLLVNHIHQTTMHGGPNLILSQIRSKYWVPGIKITIKQLLNSCVTCHRWKRTSPTQIMGNLPQDRINFERPFYAVGIDYAGPINIKLNKTRNAKTGKAYIAVFVCFATKALHIEVVSDLSSEAFMASLRRFFSRRGVCKEIYTDNGTNFVGAQKMLDKEIQSALKNSLNRASEYFTNQNINWNFIPPGAPHFGGLWEAGVKSIKYHLRRIIGQANLTFEELSTVLTQIEAVLNSRPLCPLSSDPEDFNALTPGHFLIGQAPLSLPEQDWDQSKISHLSRWQHIQKLKHDFWKRWVSEYLPRLQQRHKWKIEQPSIEAGDLVLLKEDNLLPSAWKFARILATHPGRDNKVRVVTLKTPSTILKRPISKICLLPFHQESF